MDESGDGDLRVFACDHKHPDQASAQDWPLGEALGVLAKRELDTYLRPGDIRALQDALARAFTGMAIAALGHDWLLYRQATAWAFSSELAALLAG